MISISASRAPVEEEAESVPNLGSQFPSGKLLESLPETDSLPEASKVEAPEGPGGQSRAVARNSRHLRAVFYSRRANN